MLKKFFLSLQHLGSCWRKEYPEGQESGAVVKAEKTGIAESGEMVFIKNLMSHVKYTIRKAYTQTAFEKMRIQAMIHK